MPPDSPGPKLLIFEREAPDLNVSKATEATCEFYPRSRDKKVTMKLKNRLGAPESIRVSALSPKK